MTSTLPGSLQQFISCCRGAAQRKSSPFAAAPPALVPAPVAAEWANVSAQPAAAGLPSLGVTSPAAAAATAVDQLDGGAQAILFSRRTVSLNNESALSTDDLMRSSSSSGGTDSHHGVPGSQSSRDSSSGHLAAAVYDGVLQQQCNHGGNFTGGSSSSQQLQQLFPTGLFLPSSSSGNSDSSNEVTLQQLLLLRASGGLSRLDHQQQVWGPVQQDSPGLHYYSSSDITAADTTAVAVQSSDLAAECALVCHEELMESPRHVACQSQQDFKPQQHKKNQSQQHAHRDQYKQSSKPVTVASTTAAGAAALRREVGDDCSDRGQTDQNRQPASLTTAFRPILDLGGDPGRAWHSSRDTATAVAAVPADVQLQRYSADTATAVGSGKRAAQQMGMSGAGLVSKRPHMATAHGLDATAAAEPGTGATYSRRIAGRDAAATAAGGLQYNRGCGGAQRSAYCACGCGPTSSGGSGDVHMSMLHTSHTCDKLQRKSTPLLCSTFTGSSNCDYRTWQPQQQLPLRLGAHGGSSTSFTAGQVPPVFCSADHQHAAVAVVAADDLAEAVTWRPPPKQHYKQQQQKWHKLQQQQQCAQLSASKQPQLSLTGGSAVSSEWSAVYGLLMLSRD